MPIGCARTFWLNLVQRAVSAKFQTNKIAQQTRVCRGHRQRNAIAIGRARTTKRNFISYAG
jgi:hypothetical protein